MKILVLGVKVKGQYKKQECMKLCSKTPTPVEVSMMSIYPRRMFNIVL
ncbi:hypothetical protein HanIR_Chr11g0526871 [Helianthus annuus]|nr:hypothetical protein HanIR_Chr11g0526871 [Helianthus annuus]